jgi:cytoskeletal protein CcmA (bactofilin family)
MFLNNKKNGSKIETIVGPDTDIEGNLHTQHSIRIDGKVKGEVRADAVIIGDFGVVMGDVTADTVTVGGKIKGNISAHTMLELLPKAQVTGDIRTEKLIISDGAHFEGNCQMQSSDGQVLELKPQALEVQDGHNGQRPLKVVGGNNKH